MLAPVEILGALANYFYLRNIGGTAQKEKSQERRYSVSSLEKHADLQKYREEKNSFWPDFKEILNNEWAWYVVGAGVVGAGVEQLLHQFV